MTRTHLLIVLVCAGAAGCAAKQQTAVETTTRETVKAASPKQQTPGANVSGTDSADPADSDPRPDTGPIFYALDSAQLLPESQERLRTLAEWLRRHPKESVSISGHTCDLGTSEYNLALGQKRAAAAREYLVRLGVDERNVSVLSYGEEQPALAGADEDTRSQNRRSEFELRVLERRSGLR